VNFDAFGAALVTGGMLLLVYGLVRAPIEGWGSAQTVGVLAGAVVVLAAFVANERRQRAPLAPLSIFRINGLGFSNVTQLVAFAGFLALFFYVTLYMQNILGYSAVQTGLAYLPLCGIAVVGAGISSQLLGRVGTRPVIVVGAMIGAAGLYWLSRISVGGSYTADLLPGLLLVGLGIAGLFVAVATAANAGVPADKAGLAAALLNASQWLGGALGLAIFTAVSTSRTNHLLAAGTPSAHALTSGFQRALLVGSIFILASAVIALRATNTRGETAEPAIEAELEASLAA
jgi:predicted MFS family arabinose efflux permease